MRVEGLKRYPASRFNMPTLPEPIAALIGALSKLPGIGPKSALSLLSGIKMEDLVVAIAKGSVDQIRSVPGIGLKTAQKLIIELKEKVAKAKAKAKAKEGKK